jgi:hypothetical protein
MPKLPNFAFKGTKARYVLIGILAVLACVLFYFFGFLFIQTILLVGYVSIFPAILIWEKKKRERAVIDPSRLSEDERWSKTKMKVEKIERRIQREKDTAEKSALLRQKRYLESELRQLEWKIRETEMTQLYNASKGNMKQIDSTRSVITTVNALNAEFKRQQAKKGHLLKILKDVEDIMKNEPLSSREISLMRVANDLKAQYNALKRKKMIISSRNGNSESSRALLSDYWACWVAVTSLAKGFAVEKNLAKYTSADFQPEFSKFMKSTHLEESSSLEKRNVSSVDGERTNLYQ